VLKSILKTSIYIACMAMSGIACAAGLGGINVTSSLGQPLRAEIDVTSVDRTDKSTLRAKLASADAYKNAGIDYPYNLPKLKFLIDDRENGDSFIKVTSLQPVNDPFVTLMVELSWSTGKLLREYTFLLDPVDYKPQQPKAEEVKPIEPVLEEPVAPISLPQTASETVAAIPSTETPVVAAPSAEAPAVAAAPITESASAPAAVPDAESAVAAVPATETETVIAEKELAEQPLTQESAPEVANPAAQDALSKEEALAEAVPGTSSEHITVLRGDTLSKIAAQIKPDNVSLERMLVALYRENAGEFGGHNMNRIRAGKILNIPRSDAVQMLPQADAEEEIRAQAADWNVYRQKLAAAVPVKTERPVDKQEATGKISSAVIDKAYADKEPAKEVLKLSKGEAPNDKAVGGGKTSAQEMAIAKEEEAIAKSKALKEAQERTAILEKNVQDMKRLAEMKKETAPVSAPAAAITMNAASAPQPASSVAAAKPKPKVVAPKVVEQPSLIDQLMGNPLYLAGAAALLLVLGGLGFVVARRGKPGGDKNKVSSKNRDDVGSTTGRIAAPIAPSPDTGDFTHATPHAAPAASTDSEEVDPIGEADLFLTFGRDAQAEEVLKEALKKNPNNIPVKLKLLSIYVTRKDPNSFYGYAREIKESGDKSAWDQAVAMGLELDPTNPFYGGNASAAAVAFESKANSSAPAPVKDAAPSVDFDLGFGSSAAAKPNFSSQTTAVLETPAQERTTIMSPQAMQAMQSASLATPMDFDITGTNPGSPAMNYSGDNLDDTATLNMEDLVFDVTQTHPRIPTIPAPEAPAAKPKDDGVSFMLDFPTETKAKVTPARSLGLDEITLNLDQSGSSSASSGASSSQKDELWQEVATKLDLAKAYQEMGDVAGAREILDEVLRDGDAKQREGAQTLMQQLL
jgi:pilus assembly protein FimV